MSNVIHLCNCTDLHPRHVEVQAFTKNDWYGYSGSSKFADGNEPMIAYVQTDDDDKSYTVIVGGTGEPNQPEAVVHIDTTDEDGSLRYGMRYFTNKDHAIRYANFLASNPDMIESLHTLEQA